MLCSFFSPTHEITYIAGYLLTTDDEHSVHHDQCYNVLNDNVPCLFGPLSSSRHVLPFVTLKDSDYPFSESLFKNKKMCKHVIGGLNTATKLYYNFCFSLAPVLKHRAFHVRHSHLPLSREEEEARVINCGTSFRNRFEALRRCFNLV